MSLKPEHEVRSLHPCVRCGACCGSFRVSFTRQEWDAFDVARKNRLDQVVVSLGGNFVGMRGAEIKHRPCCHALQGKIGHKAVCTVYQDRPSPCRDFVASYADGKTRQPRCDQARQAHGLSPLKPRDWIGFLEPESIQTKDV